MPYQYKRKPLSDDEVNRLTNTCDNFREKFVVWTLLRMSFNIENRDVHLFSSSSLLKQWKGRVNTLLEAHPHFM